MNRLLLPLLVTLPFPSVSVAAKSSSEQNYVLTCEGYETPRRANNEGLPPHIRFTANVKLVPHSGEGHVCNDAVTAPDGQPVYKVTSKIIARIQKANSDDYLKLTSEVRAKFGECQLDPFEDELGVFSIYGKEFDPEIPHGRYGASDPSRPDREYEFMNVQMPLRFADDGSIEFFRERFGENNVNSDFDLHAIPLVARPFPFEVGYYFTKCEFDRFFTVEF